MAVPSWKSEAEVRREGTMDVCPCVFVEELGRGEFSLHLMNNVLSGISPDKQASEVSPGLGKL